MNSLLLTVSLLIAATSAEQFGIFNAEAQNLLINSGKECIAEFKYPADYIGLVSQPYIPIEKDEKCFYDCFYRKLGVLGDKKYNKDALEAFSKVAIDKESPKYLLPVVDRCKVTSFKRCRPGYELQRCLSDFHRRFQAIDDALKMKS